jgi:hypothetical protein
VDSGPDTRKHIATVNGLLRGAAADLCRRGYVHDRSKLAEPEKATFDRVTEKLSSLTYGSEEYKAALAEMGPALDHHYAQEDHHPEHGDGTIGWMSLLQLTEMLCDWIAAGRRHEDSDIHRSIDINAGRFGYGEEIRALLHNSVEPLLANEAAKVY